MWLTRVSVNHPVFATMMMLALMVLGLASWQRMKVEEFPSVDFPYVVISTVYPGASPEVVEADVSRPLEDSINTIAGVKQVISTSRDGMSLVIVQFDLNVPSTLAAQDVRDRIAQIRPTLREGIKDPTIERYDPSSVPVVSVVFRSSTMPMRELSSYLDQVVSKRLQTVTGVGKVNLLGTVKRQIRVALDPVRLQAMHVSVDQVLNTLRTENVELPSGYLKDGGRELVVQIQGRLVQPQQFGRLVVARPNGQPIYLEQVADVQDAQADQDSAALINGQNAVGLDIIKSSGANVIGVVDATRARLEEIRPTLPPGVEMTVVADSAQSIRASLNDVVRTLIEGGILAVLIVLLFLGSWRSTIITGLTLPISLFGTLMVMNMFGFTINVMTLMALSLCIGLLIDDAIVVRENIVRHAAMGKDHRRAALDGTEEISLAVMATTLTIVAVFLPVAFMEGIIGRFFYQFGVTVSAAVLLSMFVSFTLDPMLSSIWPEVPPDPFKKPNLFRRGLDAFERLLEGFSLWYSRLLARCLHWRKTTLLAAFASLVVAFMLAGLVGKEFVPTPDLGEIGVKFETPVDASLEYTLAKVHQVDALLRQEPEVTQTYTSVNSVGYQGRNRVQIRVLLKPKHQRKRGLEQMNVDIRERLGSVAGITVTSVASAKESVSGGVKPILISIKGSDLNELRRISAEFMAGMQKIPGVVDLESSLKSPKPTLSVQIDREAASDLGLSVGQVGAALRPLLAGEKVSTWKDAQGENYDVEVRLPEDLRRQVSTLASMTLSSSRTDPQTGLPLQVPLSQVARLTQTLGASQINRRDLFREVLVSANTQGRPAGDIGEDVTRLQNQTKLPPGYSFQVEGANKDMAESAASAAAALVLGILFIYMLLASQFNSFLLPMAIMSSLPLSLIGVFLALFLFGSTLNIFSIIGIIMLMGLVTKNAILLIDFTKEAIAKGDDRITALIDAGRTRMRPILMTTTAMVVGMVPLALGLGEGAEQRAPMAHAIIGGVITSTLLTLVVVPVIYTFLDDAKIGLIRLFRWVRG